MSVFSKESVGKRTRFPAIRWGWPCAWQHCLVCIMEFSRSWVERQWIASSDQLLDARVRYPIVRVPRESWQSRVAGRSSSVKASTCHFLTNLRQMWWGGPTPRVTRDRTEKDVSADLCSSARRWSRVRRTSSVTSCCMLRTRFRGSRWATRCRREPTRKEHSQRQARKDHSQRQAERTRRSASPTSSPGVWWKAGKTPSRSKQHRNSRPTRILWRSCSTQDNPGGRFAVWRSCDYCPDRRFPWCKNSRSIVWDVGGEDATRPLRRHYYHGTNGLIYVVDSNSQETRVDRGRRLLSFHRCNSWSSCGCNRYQWDRRYKGPLRLHGCSTWTRSSTC